MTVIRRAVSAFTRPVLSWTDTAVFAFLTLVSSQYHWAWWLNLLVFAAFGAAISAEHDWLGWRASRKKGAAP